MSPAIIEILVLAGIAIFLVLRLKKLKKQENKSSN